MFAWALFGLVAAIDAECSHILVKGSDALEKIQDLKKQLDTSSDVPKDFAELAKKHSGYRGQVATDGSFFFDCFFRYECGKSVHRVTVGFHW